MRIETSKRVTYEHNPLAEVICQVQFTKLQDLSDGDKTAIRQALSDIGYTSCAEEVSFGFSQQIVINGPPSPQAPPIAFPQSRLQHFTTQDNLWRVSISTEFFALTCLKYVGWDQFLPRMLAAIQLFVEIWATVTPTRLGLRYKDVIEREPLGLSDVPWHELIRPFLLGPLAPGALADGQTAKEAEVENFLSQTSLQLEHARLLLQSSLLASIDGQRRAFLIDADFSNEENLESELLAKPAILKARLERLHASAGDLFRRGITERLHHALRPSN